MPKARFAEEQMAAILHEADRRQAPAIGPHFFVPVSGCLRRQPLRRKPAGLLPL